VNPVLFGRAACPPHWLRSPRVPAGPWPNSVGLRHDVEILRWLWPLSSYSRSPGHLENLLRSHGDVPASPKVLPRANLGPNFGLVLA